MELSDIRHRIDAIDAQLLDLFSARMALCEEVAAYKNEHNLPVFDRAREQALLDRVTERAGDRARYARCLYSMLLALSRARQAELLSSGADLSELEALERICVSLTPADAREEG